VVLDVSIDFGSILWICRLLPQERIHLGGLKVENIVHRVVFCKPPLCQ